jgi:hypothetical protein
MPDNGLVPMNTEFWIKRGASGLVTYVSCVGNIVLLWAVIPLLPPFLLLRVHLRAAAIICSRVWPGQNDQAPRAPMYSIIYDASCCSNVALERRTVTRDSKALPCNYSK